jgi:hypothetical protein
MGRPPEASPEEGHCLTMQRNNIAMHYPAEVKAEAVRLREVDGLPPGKVRETLAARHPELPRVHATTWASWTRSREYRELRDRILDWDRKIAPRRWAALVQNDGHGPQTVADLAEMAVLEQLHGLAESGAALESGDIVKVARAITTMQRTQLARRSEELDTRLRAMEDKHAAELADKDAMIAKAAATIAALEAEIERMRNPQTGPLTAEEKIDAIRDRLGVK